MIQISSINYLIILGKQYNYQCGYNEKTAQIAYFINISAMMEIIEFYIANKRDNLDIHGRKLILQRVSALRPLPCPLNKFDVLKLPRRCALNW